MSVYEQDNYDMNKLYELLENEILPAYYDNPNKWRKIQYNSMNDVKDQFNSDRMADEYYQILYNYEK
jgi:starch phosphorylase